MDKISFSSCERVKECTIVYVSLAIPDFRPKVRSKVETDSREGQRPLPSLMGEDVFSLPISTYSRISYAPMVRVDVARPH